MDQNTPPSSAPSATRGRSILQALNTMKEGAQTLFNDPFTGPLGERLRDAQRDVVLERAEILIWISVFVMPTTIWTFVYFLARPGFGLAVAIVLTAVAGVLVQRALIVRGFFDKHYHLAMLLLVGGIFGPTGAAIVEVSRKSQADFFFTFFLIFFSFTALFPANASWILATAGTLIASYVGVRVFRPEGLVFDAELISNLIYLSELTFIGVVLNRVVVSLFFDERRARFELAGANEELRELDRAKSTFFSNVSHELRTPLTLILTPIAHLLNTRAQELPADVVSRLEGVRGNAQRLLKMVNILLDFSKLEAGKAAVIVSDFDLRDVVEHIANLFEGTAEQRGVRLVVDVGDAPIPMRSDLEKLEQSLVNLMGNALKFTPSGGTVTLRARAERDHVRIEVADTGAGIAPENHEKIFQRFVQVRGAQQTSVKGTGIGLAMVREYARLLGGEVGVTSALGSGSTFTLRIATRVAGSAPENDTGPTRDAALAVADLVQDESAELREVRKAGPGRKTVLVVDDNPGLVRLVVSILQDEHDLVLAYSGEEALERLAKEHVDLVVSDVMMPGISGLELCRRIKSDPRTEALPVILLTARGGTDQKVQGLEHGADDYIGKPFDPEELRARVRSLFEVRALLLRLAEKTNALEAALAQVREEELKLVESEKMRTLGDLAAGIFHELHNYINMIANGAAPLKELVVPLLKDGPGAEIGGDVLELIDLMIEASHAARGVTQELKGFAHQGPQAAVVVDVHDVLRSNVRMFGRLRGDVVIENAFAGERLPVECMPNRMMLVFTNLMKNAIEAMDGKGTLTLHTERDGTHAVVRVRDNGPGVPVDQRAMLFEPFRTTKKRGEGLGLGLSMARKVVHDHGGDLRLDPEFSGGAQFVITLPLASGASVELRR